MVDYYDKLKIVSFPPTDTSGAIDTLVQMYRDGEVRDVIIYAPSEDDLTKYHFFASGGLILKDILLAKHQLGMIAHKLSEADGGSG